MDINSSTNPNPSPPKNYSKRQKAIFLIYEVLIKEHGKHATQLKRQYISLEISKRLSCGTTEAITIESNLRKMVKDGYETDLKDPEVIELLTILRERGMRYV